MAESAKHSNPCSSLNLPYFRQLGDNLFPCRQCILGEPSSKMPLERGYQRKHYPDEILLKYAARGHGIGWVIPDGMIVLDIDAATPERPYKRGLESLPALWAMIGEELLHVGSNSPTGGMHFYVRVPLGAKFMKSHPDLPGIDIRTPGQYVLIPGSPHWQGGRDVRSND